MIYLTTLNHASQISDLTCVVYHIDDLICNLCGYFNVLLMDNVEREFVIALYLASNSNIHITEWYELVKKVVNHELFYKYLFTCYSSHNPKESIITELRMTERFIREYRQYHNLAIGWYNLSSNKDQHTSSINDIGLLTNNELTNSELTNSESSMYDNARTIKDDNSKSSINDIGLLTNNELTNDIGLLTNNEFYNEILRDHYKSFSSSTMMLFFEDNKWVLPKGMNMCNLIVIHRCSTDPMTSSLFVIFDELDKYVLQNPNDFSYSHSEINYQFKQSLDIDGYTKNEEILLPNFKTIGFYTRNE